MQRRPLYCRIALPSRGSNSAPGTHRPQAVRTREGVYCNSCLHLITSLEFKAVINGQHQHTMFNPAGLLFELCCFWQAPGMVNSGKPSTDFSWFSGYGWQASLCGNCRRHLGWRFSGPQPTFFALITNRLLFGTAP